EIDSHLGCKDNLTLKLQNFLIAIKQCFGIIQNNIALKPHAIDWRELLYKLDLLRIYPNTSYITHQNSVLKLSPNAQLVSFLNALVLTFLLKGDSLLNKSVLRLNNLLLATTHQLLQDILS